MPFLLPAAGRLGRRLLHGIATRGVSALAAASLVSLSFSASAADSASRPNVVFILADDLGYGDVGCYNPDSKIPTPHIDRLAVQGTRFTDAHAAASVCVPTRYSLLTGRYSHRRPNRNGNFDGGPLIEDGVLTLPAMLRQAGYRTAMIGKWHLGFAFEDFETPLGGGPADRGFESFFGVPASTDIPPYFYVEGDRAVAAPTETIDEHHSEGVRPIQGAFWRSGGIAPGLNLEEVLPTFAEKALAELDGRAKTSDQPFFLYLALTAPHTPWLPSDPFRGKSRIGGEDRTGATGGLSTRAERQAATALADEPPVAPVNGSLSGGEGVPQALRDYGDFVVQVDDVVGRILAKLDEHGLTDDTLVIVTSDNGPTWYEEDVRRTGHDSAGPWRGMKGDVWEAGHRVPFVVRWPGRVPAGRTNDELIGQVDLMATLAALVGQDLPLDAAPDSENLLPLLLGEGDAKGREVLVAQSSAGVLTLRKGPWKFIPHLGSAGFSQPRREKARDGEPTVQLYHLDDDPGETTNLAGDRPEVVKEMTALLERLRESDRTAR